MMTVFSDVLSDHPDLQDLGSRSCPRREPRCDHGQLERGYLLPLSHGITTGDEMLDTWEDRETVRVLEHGMHERQLAALPLRVAVPVPVVLKIPVISVASPDLAAITRETERLLELPEQSVPPHRLPTLR